MPRPKLTPKPTVPTYQPKQRHTLLSAAERSELVRRYKSGERAFELARAYGIHKSTVSDIAERAGVKRSWSMTDMEREEAIRLYAKGWSCARIGRQLHRDASTIHRVLVVAGVQLRDPQGRERA